MKKTWKYVMSAVAALAFSVAVSSNAMAEGRQFDEGTALGIATELAVPAFGLGSNMGLWAESASVGSMSWGALAGFSMMGIAVGEAMAYPEGLLTNTWDALCGGDSAMNDFGHCTPKQGLDFGNDMRR